VRRSCISAIGVFAVSAGALYAQVPDDLSQLTGEGLYVASCAACHGADGSGLDRSLLGFEEEVPDFTDCDFAAREPDGDWIAVAHEGGPVRGFSEMMPAFRGALTPDQLQLIMNHIRTQCTDPNWPRGELNLPRGLVTEKAYPEDEWVVETGADLEGDGFVSSAFVYERRFGARSQIEVKIPWSIGPSTSTPRAIRRSRQVSRSRWPATPMAKCRSIPHWVLNSKSGTSPTSPATSKKAM